MAKKSAAETAVAFESECKRLGWLSSVRGTVVTIYKSFTPGDKLAYSDCDNEAYGILGLAPLKGGSVWGTDGGSIGGATGLDGGYYRLNKSGSGAFFLMHLSAIKARTLC